MKETEERRQEALMKKKETARMFSTRNEKVRTKDEEMRAKFIANE
jgi:hypothetical protein